jgi:hypothetical protein
VATNIKRISEQVLRRLNSGDPPVAKKTHEYEVREAIMQCINALLRPQYFTTLQAGETVPEGSVLCNYTSVPVTAWNGISKSVLPAIPIALPKNLGVFRISKSADPLANDFIPIPMGQWANVVTQRLMNDLLGQIGYEIRGKEIYYTKDLTALSPAVTSVTMQLVVMDISTFTDYELLPINADMGLQVVEQVYQLFAPLPTRPAIIDPTNDSK